MARRISIGPGEVAGYFSRLKNGFVKSGQPCEHFVLTEHIYGYSKPNFFLSSVYRLISRFNKYESNIFRRVVWLVEKIFRVIVLFYAIVRCDVFIFSGSATFFRFYELPLLKLFRKKLIFVYLGSDARPPYLSGRYLDDAGALKDSISLRIEVFEMKKAIKKVEKYADFIINHTATAQFFQKDFVKFHSVGVPVEFGFGLMQQTEELKTGLSGTPNSIRILHAPSRPLAKGSNIFKAIIGELRLEGFLIDYIELRGVSNSDVLRELADCDFVIDELYSDVPMAVLATEAARFRKPVVVGSYYAKEYFDDNSLETYPPALFVNPKEIKPSIRKMIVDKEFRLALGEQAYNFVKRNWESSIVARNYLRLIDNDIPTEWIGNPKEFNYLWGWGLSRDNWMKQVSMYVEQQGIDALLLDHNTRLSANILQELGCAAKGRAPRV